MKKLDEAKTTAQVMYTPFVWSRLQDEENRIIYLYGEINSFDNEDDCLDDKVTAGYLVQKILDWNREDIGIEVGERKPIKIYINSPGGSVYDGFPIVSAIDASKTPVYTYNIGMWSSMAFLIGITGHKRFSLPNMMFLMHDGSDFMYGTSGKVQDEAKFRERYEREVIKEHILKHSKMTDAEYEILVRVEYYMLPKDALEHGFIDEIVTNDLDKIL